MISPWIQLAVHKTGCKECEDSIEPEHIGDMTILHNKTKRCKEGERLETKSKEAKMAKITAAKELEQEELNNPLVFKYKNHQGITTLRTVVPKSIRFASTEWHPERQWLMRVVCGPGSNARFCNEGYGR